MKHYTGISMMTAATALLLASCSKDRAEMPDISLPSASDIINASHLSSSDTVRFDETALAGHTLSGTAVADQFYSVIPLYAYASDKSNYTGDIYLVEATVSIASDHAYQGLNEVNGTLLCGFFLSGYEIEFSMEPDTSKAAFAQFPAPSTTINSKSYTSGISWSADVAVSGGKVSGGTVGGGVSISNSRSYTISDVSIVNNSSSSDGKVSYRIKLENLPKSSSPEDPPLVSRKTLDMHFSWIWQLPNTPEYDTTSTYRMRTEIRDLTYKCAASRWLVKESWSRTISRTFPLPPPERIPTGTVTLVNGDRERLLSGITFSHAGTGAVYRDSSGSFYAYGRSYEASLPEGEYELAFTLGEASCTSGPVKVERGKSIEIDASYYL